MPAVSKKQQRFFGMVRAAQKGEGSASPEVAKVASEISKDDAKKFAKTKHKGLPMKKEAMTHQEALDAGWEMTGEGIWIPPQDVTEGDVHSGQGEKIQKRTKAWMDKKGQKGAPGLDAIRARAAEHKAKRGVKEEVVDEPEGEVIDETNWEIHKLKTRYGDKSKLSKSSWYNQRRSKNPDLRQSKKEFRKSVEDDAAHEKKMGRSKPTPSNLKTALKKQRANEELTFEGWKDKAGDAIKKALKKKDAPKHDYGKDAGAEARKKIKDKEHNKYVSFLDAPDD